MFRRKKEAEKEYDDYYYDDYYYDDDNDDDDYYYYYYDEDDYDYDEDEEETKSKVVSKKEQKKEQKKESKKEKIEESPVTKDVEAVAKTPEIPAVPVSTPVDGTRTDFVDAVVIAQLDEQRQELEALRLAKAELEKTNTELQTKFATVSALPTHYQQLESDSVSMRAELAAVKAENDRLQAENIQSNEKVGRAEATVRHYQRELSVKQSEIDQLHKKVLNVEATSETDSLLTSENIRLQAELRDLTEALQLSKQHEETITTELVRLKNELIEATSDVTKNDIAEVMLDARAKARQIVEQSRYEANRIVAEAEQELATITRNAETLYQRVYNTKVDSVENFDDLLTKLSVLSAQDRSND